MSCEVESKGKRFLLNFFFVLLLLLFFNRKSTSKKQQGGTTSPHHHLRRYRTTHPQQRHFNPPIKQPNNRAWIHKMTDPNTPAPATSEPPLAPTQTTTAATPTGPGQPSGWQSIKPQAFDKRRKISFAENVKVRVEYLLPDQSPPSTDSSVSVRLPCYPATPLRDIVSAVRITLF